MIGPTEYDAIANRLENDLNKRFPRIAWEVDRWRMRDVYASADMVVSASIVNTTPEEFYEWTMSRFCISFSMKIDEEQLSGRTEIGSTLLTDSYVDVAQHVAGMVSRAIADKILE